MEVRNSELHNQLKKKMYVQDATSILVLGVVQEMANSQICQPCMDINIICKNRRGFANVPFTRNNV